MTASWYEIRVEEILDSQWSQWFEGMEISPTSKESSTSGTLLRGSLPDQAALFGILSKVRSLNLTLMEVKRINRLATNVNEVDLDNL